MAENTIEFRRGLKQQTPQVFLMDKHTRACVVLPDRTELLRRLPKNGVAAEIGVAFGDYTAEILANAKPRKLHLVDSWFSERYRQGLDTLRETYADQIAKKRVIVDQGLSLEKIAEYRENYFDWVYIDTDHSYATTLAELHLVAPKMKPGGLIAGHDFCPGNVIAPWPYGVIEACNQFCVEAGWSYRFLTLEPHGHQSFALAKL